MLSILKEPSLIDGHPPYPRTPTTQPKGLHIRTKNIRRFTIEINRHLQWCNLPNLHISTVRAIFFQKCVKMTIEPPPLPRS